MWRDIVGLPGLLLEHRRRRGGRLRRPVVQLHAQGEPHLGEDLLDLLQRLAAEVLRLEHLRLGLLHQIADGLDVGVLQAVRRANRELQLVHRAEEVLVELLLRLDRRLERGGLLCLVEADEDRQLLLDDLRRVGDRVGRRDAPVGPHLEREPVVVGDLADARVGDLVVDLLDRAEQRVDRDHPDRLARHLVPLRRDVAAAAPGGHLHADAPALADGEEVVAGVEHLDVLVDHDVAGLHFLGALDLDADGLLLLRVHAQQDFLEVQDDVRHVLGDVGDGGELVLHSLDADGGDRRALQRGEQHAPERVPQGDAETALERLGDELAVGVGEGLLIDRQPAGLDQVAPVLGHQSVCHCCFSFYGAALLPDDSGLHRVVRRLLLPYPILRVELDDYRRVPLPYRLLRVELDDQLLLDGHGDVVARGLRLDRALERALVQLEPGRHAAALHRLERLVDADDLGALVLDRDLVADFDLEGGDVHLPGVHAEVAVPHQLARLRAGVGEAEPEDHVVEALLEELEQVLAGLPLGGRAARVVAAELRLEQAVEALDLLLLAQLHAVLGELGAALAVLARRVGAALDGALVRVAAVALQVHLQVFAPADAAGAFRIASHRLCVLLHAAALGRPATVVRDGRDVADERDLEAGGGQRAQRRLAARPRALHQHAHVLEAVLHRLGGRVARRHLRGERSRLARALESARARRRPADHVPAHVGDGDDGVVERALDADDPGLQVLLGLLLRLLRRRRRRCGSASGSGGRGWLLLFGHVGSVLWLCLRRRGGGDRAADDRALRPLARARVGVGPLAAHGQALAVAQAAVAAQVHQPLDVEAHLAAQVALDLVVLLQRLADPVDLVVGQVLGPPGRIDLGQRAHLLRAGVADPVQVRERDLDLFLAGKVDSRDARHLSLPLLVARIRGADHAYHALAADHLALHADLPHRSADLHGFLPGPRNS